MTRWRVLLPLLAPLLSYGAVNQLPAHFEPRDYGFLARSGQGTYLLTETGALRFSAHAEMRFAGANPAVEAEPIRRLPGKTNYLRGSDPARWRTGVTQFGGVRYANLYPGVDLIYHADSGLEYDLLIAPRVSPRRIAMEFPGAQSVHLGRDGGLIVRAGDGELRFDRPHISQDGRAVRGGYRLLGMHRAAFWIGDYDHNRPLLIDPVVGAFGTLGAMVLGIATDAVGNVYVAGNADGIPIYGTPPLVNALQPNLGLGDCSPETKVFEPCQDVFVTKLDPTGKQIIYSTYLGDNGADWFGGLAVDFQGNAYLAASGYPAGFASSQPIGTGHAFVRKLSPDGSALLYDKSLGANTQAGAIAVDATGNAYIAGTSFSASFPAVHAVQPQSVITPIYVTRDGGASWSPVHAPAPTVNMLAIPPGSSTTLYAATSVGLMKSLDGGASWTNLIPTAIAATVVVLDPKTPSTVYAVYAAPPADFLASQSVLARSLDAGATWSILSGIPPGSLSSAPPSIAGLAIDPENSSTLWIATFGTVGGLIDKSLDGGGTWRTVYSPALKPPPFPFGPTVLAVDPTNGARVYACCVGYPGGGEGGSLFSTQDGGATWSGGGIGGVNGFALDPSNPSVLYAAGYDGLYRSSDDGASWFTVNLPPVPQYFNNVVISATGVIYTASDAGYFLRSADHGGTWTVTNGPWGSGATVLAIDPAQPGTVYVGSPQRQIQDAFAAKLDSTGNTIWATLLGGSGYDSGQSIAVDAKGNVYLAGTTSSSDFPLLNAVQSALGPVSANTVDAFVAEISADGSTLVYSTYLGAEVENAVVGVDGSGEAFVAGITGFSDFPLVNPMFSAFGTTYCENYGYCGGFVSKIAAGGRNLVFSTFFPANPVALTVDSAGEPWLAGGSGVQLPMVQPIQPSDGSGFLTHLNSSGSAALFSTFLCGSVSSLTFAPGASVWVAGRACYNDFPSIGTPNGPLGYVARIDAAPPAAQTGIPRIDGVYNGGGFQWGNAVAPGEVVTLLGAELASSTASGAGAPLPMSLSDAAVTVGGIAAPLFYVSPGQINFQAPTNLTLGVADLAVARGTTVTHRAVNVVAAQPGIFFVNGVPAVTHASDFSLVTASNPAHPGEYLAVFCSGLGLTTPVVPAGQISPFAPSKASGFISIGTGAEVYFQYAGLSPGSIGLYQINFQLPLNSVMGVTDLFLQIGYQFTQDVPLYVR